MTEQLLLGLTEEAQFFDRAMQSFVAEAMDRPPDITEDIAAALQAHGIGVDMVRPDAAPDRVDLELLRDEDWEDIAISPEPFVTLWSHVNRERIERHWKSLPRAEWSSPEEVDFGKTILHAMPVVQSATVESLNLAIKAGSFLSNRVLVDQDDINMSRRGHTHAEDREMGLDGKVFLDFGRPHSGRMGEAQSDVIVVFEPDIMQQSGSFVTENDIMFDEAEHGSIQPVKYMKEVLTGEEFYKVGLHVIETKTSEQGDPQTISGYARGEDSNYNQYGNPSFSAFEVKVPQALVSRIRHLIFRDQATCDAFTAEHSDRFITMVVPDVRAALLRGEDVMGTNAIVDKANKKLEETDYQERVERLAAIPENERTVTYVVVPDGATITLNPGTGGQDVGGSPEEAVRQLHQINNIRTGALSSLGHEEELPELITSARVARVVSGGGAAVIEDIEDYPLQ